MRSLAEGATKPCRQTNLGFPELVAEFVGSGERVFPALLAVSFQEVDLGRFGCKG